MRRWSTTARRIRPAGVGAQGGLDVVAAERAAIPDAEPVLPGRPFPPVRQSRIRRPFGRRRAGSRGARLDPRMSPTSLASAAGNHGGAHLRRSRAGVCRDFSHLGITLCRALGIPARAVSAYAWKLEPPDFHAVFEVYLDGGSVVGSIATRLAPVEGWCASAWDAMRPTSPSSPRAGHARACPESVTVTTRLIGPRWPTNASRSPQIPTTATLAPGREGLLPAKPPFAHIRRGHTCMRREQNLRELTKAGWIRGAQTTSVPVNTYSDPQTSGHRSATIRQGRSSVDFDHSCQTYATWSLTWLTWLRRCGSGRTAVPMPNSILGIGESMRRYVRG